MLTSPDIYNGPRQLSKEVVLEFINTVKELEASDPDGAQSIAQDFYDNNRAWSPSNVVMGTQDMLDMLAKARGVPALHSTLAHNLVGELGYRLGWADEDYFQSLSDRVLTQSPVDGVESLMMYRDILEDASGVTDTQGEGVARGLHRVCADVLAAKEAPVFTRMVAQAVKESIDQIKHNPERGFVRMSGDRNGGKLALQSERTSVYERSKELARQFQSSADGRLTYLVRISSDALAVVDHTGSPLEVAMLSKEDQAATPLNDGNFKDVNDLQVMADRDYAGGNPEAVMALFSRIYQAYPDQASILDTSTAVEAGYTVRGVAEAYDKYRSDKDIYVNHRRKVIQEKGARSMQATVDAYEHVMADKQVYDYIELHQKDLFDKAQRLIKNDDEFGYELFIEAYEQSITYASPQSFLESMQNDASREGGLQERDVEEAINPHAKYLRQLQDAHNQYETEANEALLHIEGFKDEDYNNNIDVLNGYAQIMELTWPEVQAAARHARGVLSEKFTELQFSPLSNLDLANQKLLTVMHETYVQEQFFDSVGIALEDLSLSAQDKAVRYLLDCRQANFSRVKKVLSNQPNESEKVQLFEALVATEFGDDLGEIILNIAEKEPQKSAEIFEKLQNVRRNGATIAAHFGSEKGIDTAVGVAFIKRATELLALAEVEGSDSITEELHLLDDAVAQIAEAVDSDDFEVVNIDESAEYGTLQAKNSKVTVTARFHGNVPRLGMTVRYPKGQRVSIRLDYEQGKMSLDIAQTSTEANKADLSRKLGNALARGELAISKRRAEAAIRLGEQRQEVTLHGNHVREAFESIGEVMPEEFASFVNTFLYSLKMPQDPTDPETAA